MKIVLFFCLLHGINYCTILQKQYFNPAKYAISSVTFLKSDILPQTQTIPLMNYNLTLQQTMSDANYTLMIGISQLEVLQKVCRIQVSRKQSAMVIQLKEYPSSIFKCSFMFFAADSSVTQLQGYYHVLIDNSRIGIYDPDRSSQVLNASSYLIPKPTSQISFFFPVIATVQYFFSSKSPINFSIWSALWNQSHVYIHLGKNHNLQKIYISFIVFQFPKVSFFNQFTKITKNETGKTPNKWNKNQQQLTVIGLMGYQGSYPLKFSTADGYINMETTSILEFLLIQPLLESCPYGSSQVNSICQTKAGFYNQTRNLSGLCHQSCYTCFNKFSNSCLSCNPSHFKQLVNNSRCECIEGYSDIYRNYTCYKCPEKCASCLNQTYCLTCKAGFIKHSSTNSTCIACDLNCACSQLTTTCSSCNNITFRQLINGRCRCMMGYFQVYVQQVCHKCHSSCQKCESTYVCLSCNSSQLRVLNGSDCICNTFSYLQQGATQCKPCSTICLTCSSEQDCLSCNPSHFRVLNESNCLCQQKYYDSGLDICLSCQAPCETCLSALICLSCNAYESRILANFTCVCLDGYYNKNGTTTCPKCALTCLTCNNYSNCLSCNTTQFRILNGSDCLCQEEYYQQKGTQVCQVCPKPCQTCSSSLFCLSCEKGAFYLLEGKCFQIKTFPTIRNYKQDMNQVSVIIRFPVEILIQKDILIVLQIFVDDVSTQIQIEKIDTKFIIFKFNLTKPSQKLTAQFKNGSLMDANSNATLFYDVLSLDMQPVYYYGDLEVEILTTVDSVIEKASDFVTYSRLGGVVFKLVNVFLDLIEYIHQISFYVFLDCDLPSNLRKVFSTLYNALQYNILPISVSVPGADYDGFDQPEVYSKQDFSFNFLANCFLLVVQLCVSTLIYIAIGKLFASVESKSAFVKFFRGNFSRTIYSNCVDALSASQLPLCFASAVTLIDRNFSHPMKVVNFACGILFVFVVSFFPLINPLFLFSVKRSRAIDTESCYANTQKHAKLSEYYLFSKAVLSFCVAVFIPLSSAKTAVLLLLSACLFQTFYSSKTRFKSKFYRVVRLIYLTSNTISHVLLVALVFAPLELQISIGIGYAIIVLILFNMFLDVVQVLANLMSICYSLFQKCKEKQTTIVPKNNQPTFSIKKSTKFIKSERVTQRNNVIFNIDLNNENSQKDNCFEDTHKELDIKIKTQQIRLDQYSPKDVIGRKQRKVRFVKRYGEIRQTNFRNAETTKLPSAKIGLDQQTKTSAPKQFFRNTSDEPFSRTSRN